MYNNIYLLLLGCYPVTVVILHDTKYEIGYTNKVKSGGLHDKHVVATWNLGNHLSICL